MTEKLTDKYETPPEFAKCRGCGMQLNGKPYYMGGRAYHPRTRKEAKKCFYGGFVCSRRCDFNACLRQEMSMPGHGDSQKNVGMIALESIRKNWDDNE